MTNKITDKKVKPEKLILTEIKPTMTEEDIFKNLMKMFQRQGINIKK